MREQIAAADVLTCLGHTLHPQNIGLALPITKQQKNALRVTMNGQPFWVNLDRIEVIDDTTFVTIGDAKSAHAGEQLGTYRIGRAYCGFAGEGPREYGECDYGYDHDETGLPVACHHASCVQHHGDQCYTDGDIAELADAKGVIA